MPAIRATSYDLFTYLRSALKPPWLFDPIGSSTIIPGVREYRLFDGKLEIIIVILRYFFDNGRQGVGNGKVERLVR